MAMVLVQLVGLVRGFWNSTHMHTVVRLYDSCRKSDDICCGLPYSQYCVDVIRKLQGILNRFDTHALHAPTQSSARFHTHSKNFRSLSRPANSDKHGLRTEDEPGESRFTFVERF